MALTTVSATVVDSDGINWVRGTWKLEFVPNPSNPNLAQYVVDGTTHLSPAVITQNGVLDNTGFFSVTCYDSTSITPVGSGWKLTVCPLSSASCGFYNFATAGPVIDISSALTFLLPAPRFFGVYPNYGYADLEVILSNKPGSTYYNVNTQTQRYYNDVTGTWANVGTGPAGAPGPPGPSGPPVTNILGAQDPNTLTTSGVYILPDGFSANAPNPPHAFDSRGGVLEVFAYAGDSTHSAYILQRYWSWEADITATEWYFRWYATTGGGTGPLAWTRWAYSDATGIA